VDHPLRQGRDLIALDQRGTPLTGPGSLDCPELLRDYAAGERFMSDAELVSAASACQARLRSQGVDLSAYDSRHSARDLEEFRQLLGERRGFWQWNVVASSYGSSRCRPGDHKLEVGSRLGAVAQVWQTNGGRVGNQLLDRHLGR
jgi:pimeloyl-ACP methyl ester carboxylesterase